MKSTPTSPANVSSCLIAAGRYTSALTTDTDFFSRSFKYFASLAADVVLPAPCKPANKITAGRAARRLRPSLACPITFSSSCLTIFRKTWPGLKLFETSVPIARSLTAAMKSLTTGKATSASRSAIRTSRNTSCMLSSVNLARPRIRSSEEVKRFDKLSNILPSNFGSKWKKPTVSVYPR